MARTSHSPIVAGLGTSHGTGWPVAVSVQVEAMQKELLKAVTSLKSQIDLQLQGLQRQIAQIGGGEWYQVLNPNVLPQIFLKAVRVVRQPMIREDTFAPVMLPGSELTAGLGSPPELAGLVLTQARDEPTITYAMLHPAGEPLLAEKNI